MARRTIIATSMLALATMCSPAFAYSNVSPEAGAAESNVYPEVHALIFHVRILDDQVRQRSVSQWAEVGRMNRAA